MLEAQQEVALAESPVMGILFVQSLTPRSIKSPITN